jgi:hypothetical protein
LSAHSIGKISATPVSQISFVGAEAGERWIRSPSMTWAKSNTHQAAKPLPASAGICMAVRTTLSGVKTWLDNQVTVALSQRRNVSSAKTDSI